MKTVPGTIFRFALAASVALALFAQPAFGACTGVPGNLVANCSFEQPALNPGSDSSVPPGSDIGGWTVSQGGDSVDFFEKTFAGQFPVFDGNQAVDLNRDRPGGVEQTLSTVKGAKYRIVVQMSGFPAPKAITCSGTEPQQLKVSAAGASKTFSFQPDDAANPPGNQRFEAHQVDFTASGPRTLLKLQGVNDGCTGPIVDDVAVTQTSKAEPVLGQAMVVTPTSGTVLARLPTGKTFVPVTRLSEFPVGTVIDARQGVVRITATSGGKTYFADFYQGQFVLRQLKRKGATADIVLFGGSFTGCPKPPKASAAAKPKSIRHLWGSGSGPFRTVGRFASAVVRGTKWLTEDRCTGTLVKVVSGRVVVRDFVKRKNVTIRAGRQYFAAG